MPSFPFGFQDLEEFRRDLQERWEARLGEEEKARKAAKVAKLKEMEIKKEVRFVLSYLPTLREHFRCEGRGTMGGAEGGAAYLTYA